jgi:hypothetical protein
MIEEPSHVKQLSLNHRCKIGLRCHLSTCTVLLIIYYTQNTNRSLTVRSAGRKEVLTLLESLP